MAVHLGRVGYIETGYDFCPGHAVVIDEAGAVVVAHRIDVEIAAEVVILQYRAVGRNDVPRIYLFRGQGIAMPRPKACIVSGSIAVKACTAGCQICARAGAHIRSACGDEGAEPVAAVGAEAKPVGGGAASANVKEAVARSPVGIEEPAVGILFTADESRILGRIVRRCGTVPGIHHMLYREIEEISHRQGVVRGQEEAAGQIDILVEGLVQHIGADLDIVRGVPVRQVSGLDARSSSGRDRGEYLLHIAAPFVQDGQPVSLLQGSGGHREEIPARGFDSGGGNGPGRDRGVGTANENFVALIPGVVSGYSQDEGIPPFRRILAHRGRGELRRLGGDCQSTPESLVLKGGEPYFPDIEGVADIHFE